MKKRTAIIVFIEISVVIIVLYSFGFTSIKGDSMEPVLKSNDFILYLKTTNYKKGDIVLFDLEYADKILIKRIVAVSGDSVECIDGELRINGKYISKTKYDDMEMILSGDEYFMLGDNMQVSDDSRNPEIGLINKENLKGKAIYRILPFDKIGELEDLE